MVDLFDISEVIDTYSRARAIEDGILVDATALLKSIGILSGHWFKHHVALTSTLYEDVCGGDTLGMPKLQALLSAVRGEIHKGLKGASVLVFKYQGHRVKVLCGPGDSGEPVLTFMHEGED